MTVDARITRWTLEKRYGFVIYPGADESAFLHASYLPAGHTPAVGQLLEVDVMPTEKGPRVVKVHRVLDARGD